MAQQNREVLYLDWALKKPTGFRSKYPRLLSPLCFRVYARPISLCRREDTTFSLCNLVFQQVILHFFTFFRSTKGKLDDPTKTHLIPQQYLAKIHFNLFFFWFFSLQTKSGFSVLIFCSTKQSYRKCIVLGSLNCCYYLCLLVIIYQTFAQKMLFSLIYSKEDIWVLADELQLKWQDEVHDLLGVFVA